MNKGISGRLLRVKLGDKFLKCQLDATLNFTNAYEEDTEGCKPSGATPEKGTWVTRDVDSVTQDWNLTVSARVFLDALAGSDIHQGDIMKLIVDGDLAVEVEFLTTTGQHTGATNMLFIGDGVIENFDLNAPVSGKADYTLTILGDDKPTYTQVAVGG